MCNLKHHRMTQCVKSHHFFNHHHHHYQMSPPTTTTTRCPTPTPTTTTQATKTTANMHKDNSPNDDEYPKTDTNRRPHTGTATTAHRNHHNHLETPPPATTIPRSSGMLPSGHEQTRTETRCHVAAGDVAPKRRMVSTPPSQAHPIPTCWHQVPNDEWQPMLSFVVAHCTQQWQWHVTTIQQRYRMMRTQRGDDNEAMRRQSDNEDTTQGIQDKDTTKTTWQMTTKTPIPLCHSPLLFPHPHPLSISPSPLHSPLPPHFISPSPPSPPPPSLPTTSPCHLSPSLPLLPISPSLCISFSPPSLPFLSLSFSLYYTHTSITHPLF